MNSENTGETSTDSDIGTSPSGTTFASPPSSPQQTNNNLQTHHHNHSVKTHSKNHNNPGGVAQQPVHFFNPNNNNNNSGAATQRAGFYYSDPKTDSQSNSNINKQAKSQMPDQHHFMFNLNYDQKPAEKFLIDAAMSNNTSSNNINSNSKSAASTAGQADLNNPNSIIRQHSYLNAVQLNDYKLNQQKQFSNFSFFYINCF